MPRPRLSELLSLFQMFLSRKCQNYIFCHSDVGWCIYYPEGVIPLFMWCSSGSDHLLLWPISAQSGIWASHRVHLHVLISIEFITDQTDTCMNQPFHYRSSYSCMNQPFHYRSSYSCMNQPYNYRSSYSCMNQPNHYISACACTTCMYLNHSAGTLCGVADCRNSVRTGLSFWITCGANLISTSGYAFIFPPLYVPYNHL